jgi:hypothetical protein
MKRARGLMRFLGAVFLLLPVVAASGWEGLALLGVLLGVASVIFLS